MKKKRLKKRIFFNASVILAGLASPTGGSGKILSWAKQSKIQAIVSEIIVDEVMRHHGKLGISNTKVREIIRSFLVIPAPSKTLVGRYELIVIDVGDAHVLASSVEHDVDFLVTLDQKHLLALQKTIHEFSIVSPKELIQQIP